MPLWGHLLCAAAAAAALGASFWQHQRAAEKQRLQDFAEARLARPALASAGLAELPAEQLHWRQAAAVGRYDPAGQFLLDNRVFESRPGFHVIAPLQMQDDLWLLVNRGWMAAVQPRKSARPPPAPGALITVSGVLVKPGQEALALPGPMREGLIWRRLDVGWWQQQSRRRALPVVLVVAADSAAAASGLEPVMMRPDFKAATSRGYRLQWLLLAAVVIAGWLRVARVLGRG